MPLIKASYGHHNNAVRSRRMYTSLVMRPLTLLTDTATPSLHARCEDAATGHVERVTGNVLCSIALSCLPFEALSCTVCGVLMNHINLVIAIVLCYTNHLHG